MPQDFIKVNDPVTVQSVTTIVVPEDVKKELENIRTDTWKCMTDIYNLRSTVNNEMAYMRWTSMWGLEQRISALEKIVWRLEDYIEQWIDSDTMPPNNLRN